MPSSLRIGPLTTTAWAAPARVAVVECALASGCRRARTAATTTGVYLGRQPAITAFTATFSAVTSRLRVGMVLSTSAPVRPAAARAASTASTVGGMIGSPSVQPLSM